MVDFFRASGTGWQARIDERSPDMRLAQTCPIRQANGAVACGADRPASPRPARAARSGCG
ncbi:BrnA antitoxin family protein [Synechococcus sp. CS-1325]|nr:BrnA antitoxin family protein [Synechococcus sp. CS-1325]